MAPTATPVLPAPPTYLVDAVKAIGGGLYQLSITLPDGKRCNLILSLNNLTLQNVVLSTEAVGTLAMTKNGASPVLAPFK